MAGRASPDRVFDVVIIGGGVVGTAVADRLASTSASVCLLEQALDLAEGASKGNGGVTNTGFDGLPGTLEGELVAASSRRWEEITTRLDVPFHRIGELVVAMDDADESRLSEIQANAAEFGVETELISSSEARRREPLITPSCTAALWVADEGIIDPMRLTIGYGEFAARNGVDVRLGAPATGFERDADGIRAVVTPQGPVPCRFVVNAAGLFADQVDALSGADSCRMWPRKGQYVVLDREFGSRMRHVIAPVPGAEARGVFVVPTTNGTALVGPTADDEEERWDKSTSSAVLGSMFARAQRLVPSISPELAIKNFAALRPASDDVYRLRVDSTIPNVIHATGIRSTGVSSSPAVADFVLGLLRDSGLDVEDREPRHACIPPVRRLAWDSDPESLVDADPRYGQVICACEQVSAAEISAALSMQVPARSIEGVRKRTRATGGRCQGAVCMAGVAFMCSTHMDVPPQDVPVGAELDSLGVNRSDGSDR